MCLPDLSRVQDLTVWGQKYLEGRIVRPACGDRPILENSAAAAAKKSSLRLRCSLRTVVRRPLFCRANGPAARRQKLPKNPRGEHSDPFRRLRLTVVSCSPPSAPHASPRRGDNRHPHTIVRAPSALYLPRDKVLGAARREGVSATGRDRLLASITSSTRRLRRSRCDRRVSEPIPRF